LGKERRPVVYEDTVKLQYVTRFIKETMRLHSPVWSSTPRILKQDVVLGGYLIPKGVEVAPDFALLHTDPKLWNEPRKFNPDRFLDTSLNPYQYSPFFVGPRACIGKKFALLELITAISMIVQDYEVALVPNYNWVDAFPTVAMKPRDGLPLKFTRRL